MIPRDPEQLAEIVVTAARQTNQRLILSPGWGRVLPKDSLPESVFVLEHCPHQWLFPRLQGAIHHGGAGTTATTLISGIPSIVVAFFADQPAWGHTLEQLGVSPATFSATTVTTEALSESLQILSTAPSFKQRALQLQKLIQQEKGLSQTAEAIEHVLEPMNAEPSSSSR
jgi:UDP:flavonoid glycosyltransferase YjiC (YdhE family)